MSKTIFWHRRDLRIADNAGLYYALKNEKDIVPIFIFDSAILKKLKSPKDARVSFIHEKIKDLKNEYQACGSDIRVYYGNPIDVFNALLKESTIKAVYTNLDYEPYAQNRDAEVKNVLEQNGASFFAYKDQTIFEKNEVTKDDGKPYTVFTPYSKKWKRKLNDFYLKTYPSLVYISALAKLRAEPLLSLASMGFEQTDMSFPASQIIKQRIVDYAEKRDLPAIEGTSRLSLHLRFGTISIRKLAKKSLELNEKFLNELIWRDFYMMILFHFPHVVKSSFRPKYDRIVWRNNEKEFEAWCTGQTGYPIVDAGMRELNQTGFMHNRVRMITASFLTKHLLIDWRWGEAYFAEKLLDFELSSNNGGWQWASGSGCDAAPYFRVFNPTLQMKKFDPAFKYIRKWVPEFQDPFNYPEPIVDHKFARLRAIEHYKSHLAQGTN